MLLKLVYELHKNKFLTIVWSCERARKGEREREREPEKVQKRTISMLCGTYYM